MNDDYSDEGWSPFWCGPCLFGPTNGFWTYPTWTPFSHVSQLHIPNFTQKGATVEGLSDFQNNPLSRVSLNIIMNVLQG